MTWVRLDDQFPINRKVGALPDTAFRLHVEALCWCARNRTDGVVSREDLLQVTRIGKPARLVAMLVQRGLWHSAGYECPSVGCPQATSDGWVIHDFLSFNPSKNQLVDEAKKNAERQARWRDQHKQKSNAVSNGVSNGVTNGAPDPTRPHSGLGSREGALSVTRASFEPPAKCNQHIDHPTVGPCGPCADARRAHERWNADKRARIDSSARCPNPEHRGQLAHNCAICRSEQLALTGRTGAYPLVVPRGAA